MLQVAPNGTSVSAHRTIRGVHLIGTRRRIRPTQAIPDMTPPFRRFETLAVGSYVVTTKPDQSQDDYFQRKSFGKLHSIVTDRNDRVFLPYDYDLFN